MRTVLGDDWASGTASLGFTTKGQNWQDFTDLLVSRIPSPGPDDAAAGTGQATVVLTPETESASLGLGRLTLHAEGQEDGVAQIRSVQLPNMLFPPEFCVAGVQSPAIGYFPHAVTGSFGLGAEPREVVVVTPTKSIHVPVS